MPEQRQLYDYWIEIAGKAGIPCRSSFNPARLPRLLPGISLIDVATQIADCRVRLAGTRLREIFDREITGLCFSELGWGEKHDYWMEAYDRTINAAEPTQGILQGPLLGKEHVVQYWLRLPLRLSGEGVAMILCFDHFVPASELAQELSHAS